MENQTTLFELKEGRTNGSAKAEKSFDSSEWGTFKDSLRSPIHNWFPYPAGFSNRAVEHALHKFRVAKDHLIYDPFCGTGTTNIVAKTLGFDSIGVEAHPFIYFVAETKSYWEYDFQYILDNLRQIEALVRKNHFGGKKLKKEFPELVHKCFSENVLKNLYGIRESIKEIKFQQPYFDFFNLALTCILRPVANVATGWPYIAPKKKKNGREKDVFKTFFDMVLKMYGDIQQVKQRVPRKAVCRILNTDARDTKKYIENNSIDFIFTSPPYLNNYDYADRTRLETYFFGWTHNWNEISKKVRSKLIMSATTQINRAERPVSHILSDELRDTAPGVSKKLQEKIDQLSKLRLTKGGKKSYDILTGGYFSDMFQVLRDCFRILKKGRVFALILGDSAPYGVHIATDVILGEIGKAIGFSKYEIVELRRRGDKWKANPQRHNVALRETILYLKK